MKSYIPAEPLRPFIKAYLIIESQEELINRVLPDTSLVIAFRFTGRVNYITGDKIDALPSAAISGLRKSVRLINYAQDSATFLVVFKEAGAAAFFRNPLHELWEESVSLDNFISGQKISVVEEQLAEAINSGQRVAIVEAFLLNEFRGYKIDKLIYNSLQQIHSNKGQIRVKELAEKFYISQDAFEKRFRKVVGTSPKHLASIIRMRSVVKQQLPLQNISDIAFDAGYYDQPHFNKDFKIFTGQTPSDFFKSSLFW